MPYLYYILLSLLLLSACQGEKKSKGNQNQITVDNAQSRNTTGPKYVKSVQFVYPMKFDTCRFDEELKIVYANNKHYKIDSAHLFFNQQQIATLDSATREFVFKIPKEKCGTNTLKVIAFHPNNKCGVATQSFIVKPDKAPKSLQYQLVKTYSHISEEGQKLFAPERETVGLCPRCGKPVAFAKGIEVGHVFKLGTKYSTALNAIYLDENGKEQTIIMGCYGIGVSRVVAACIEQNNDGDGIPFPPPLAPFDLELLNLDPKNADTAAKADELYDLLTGMGLDVLLDDREERPGVKFKDADLVGLPMQVVVGGKGLARGIVEVKNRKTGEKGELPVEGFAEAFAAWRKSVLACWGM